MLNLTSIDWIIIGIAVTALMIALMLLRPQVSHRDAQHIRKIREEIEKDQEKVTDTLKRVEQQADHADQLGEQLKTKVEQLESDTEASQVRAEQAQRIVERATEAEHELRNISTQLGERLEHVQGYWNDQLTDTVESVNTIRAKLKTSLEGVDTGLGRLREQEHMAQGFTRKLIEHQKQQGEVQRLNTELSREVHQRLESMLVESGRTLEQIRTYQNDSDNIFRSFADKMDYMEDEANSHFGNLFQTTDIARQELNASLEESRRHLETLRRREAQSNELSQKLRTRLETNDVQRADRLTQAINATDQICGSLQTDLEKARQLLNTLEQSSNDLPFEQPATEDYSAAFDVDVHHNDNDSKDTKAAAEEQHQAPEKDELLFPEISVKHTDKKNTVDAVKTKKTTDNANAADDIADIEYIDDAVFADLNSQSNDDKDWLSDDIDGTSQENEKASASTDDTDSQNLIEPLPLDMETHKKNKSAEANKADNVDIPELQAEQDDEPAAQRKLFSLRAYR